MTEPTTVDINSVVEPTWIMIFTRPTKETVWFWDQLPASHKQYISEKFKDTGKFRSEIEISDDELTIAISYFFVDDVASAEFVDDDYLKQMAEVRDQYNLEHGIERIL